MGGWVGGGAWRSEEGGGGGGRRGDVEGQDPSGSHVKKIALRLCVQFIVPALWPTAIRGRRQSER